uniref:Spermatogenesis-associated protein 6 N-terminal domain-containing protein n=1 Tax=Periophthalmus magnuspinnatus TaxID=409849 RepID=A0A3B4BF57_9GOBI
MSPAKVHKRALKCAVLLEIHSVTCPVLLLQKQSNIYLSVCILGQYRKTTCMPPVFPLSFHQKMIFEKVKRFMSALFHSSCSCASVPDRQICY